MTTTANESLQHESQMESCETRPYSAISEHSSVRGSPTAIRDWLTSLLRDSHASHSALPASEKVMPTIETSGLKPSMSFAEYDHFSRSWRTYQVSLLTLTPDEFSETWPKAGMTVSGVGYLLPKQELRIAEIESGLLPSPRANKWGQPDSHGKPMWMFPTPAARDWKNGKGKTNADRGRKHGDNLSTAVGGMLNPPWTEWLMGWPIGHTELKPLEMDKYQQWCELHGICCATTDCQGHGNE